MFRTPKNMTKDAKRDSQTPPASPTMTADPSKGGDKTYDLIDLAKTSIDVRKSVERLELVGGTGQPSPRQKTTKAAQTLTIRLASTSPKEQTPPSKSVPQTSGRAKETAQPPQEENLKPAAALRQTSQKTKESPLKAGRRTAEARKCLAKAKHYLAQGQNIRKDIKSEVTMALDRLYQLMKEVEEEPAMVKQRKEVGVQAEIEIKTAERERKGEEETEEYPGYREAEAKDCAMEIGKQLDKAKSVSYPIKNEVARLTERLVSLVKERNLIKKSKKMTDKENTLQMGNAGNIKGRPVEEAKGDPVEIQGLRKQMEEHCHLLRENTQRMERLQDALDQQKEILEKTTYASVAAGRTTKQPNEPTTLHSVVVSSKDDEDTGEEVLNRIREVVNAKEGGIRVDRVRKAKDRKVIVGCRTEEDRNRVRERLKKAEQHLNVEDIQNKDPLLILRDVFQYNTDEDILKALRSQNGWILRNLSEKEIRLEVKYRRKTRNPHLSQVVLKVSPQIWNRMLDAGEVHIDLQRVKVADQSPLVQCSLCLAYGHGRRFCQETVEKCSHCGGPHMKANCADWLAGIPPSCCNCAQAKLDRKEHNAFSQECPVRKKWDALARASIAYC